MQSIQEKAAQIKLFILDVDGVLTTGSIFYGNNQIELKAFNLHDGLGMKLLQKTGVKIAIISAKKSEAVNKRMQDLGIEHVYTGYENKLPAYVELKNKLQIEDKNIAYMGDDLSDLALLNRVNLALTVPEAPLIVRQAVDYITNSSCGKGAVREVCELIMQAQGTYESVIQSYLSQ